ncbi:MAG: hypothetical protein K2Q12_05205 [Rickettsiales bacterium]|nr:hypothetical protein [Rickettsiales bacterium]
MALKYEEVAKLRKAFSDRPRVNTMHFTVHVTESGVRLQDQGKDFAEEDGDTVEAPDKSDLPARKERMIGITQEIAKATIGRELLVNDEIKVVNLGKAVKRPSGESQVIHR